MNKIGPNHVAIIMDGNGRWAKKQGLNRSKGHLKGSEILEEIAIHAKKRGIKILSVFAFSTDNFKRPKEEVDYLMNLFIKMFNSKFHRLNEEGVKVIFSGRRNNLPENVLKAMDEIVELTKNNNEVTLNICLNYGGQEEIVDAALKIHEDLNNGKITKEELDRNSFYKYLYNDLEPIDFLIRTSGEERISNFMLYQISYCEICFTKVLFPDFNTEEFDKCLDIFFERNRTYGEVK